MLNDFRYALRALRQNPGFALTATVSIALGIGANATIFSFSDGILFRPLPVPNPSGVLTLRSRNPSGNFDQVSYPDYADFRDQNRSFDGLAAAALRPVGFAADSKTQPQVKYGYLVNGNFFRVLGVEPRLGRSFRPEEDQAPGRDAVMIVAHSFWKNELASDPSAVGRAVRLNGTEFTIVGVLPESFTGPDLFVRPAFYLPFMMAPKLLGTNADLLTNRSDRSLFVKGRLRPGASIQAADAEAAALAKSLEQSYPKSNRGFGAAVRTEYQTRNDTIPADSLLVAFLFGLVIVALAISCANVANLMLSRGHSRMREIAVRLAIGASRGRLVRQLMAESLLIAFAGGAVGLLVAQFGMAGLSLIQIPGDVPIQLSFELDHRVLWFTVITSAATALLFGLVPALQSTKTDLVPALKAGQPEQGKRRWFGRGALVAVQVAGAVVLLVAATQMYRGFSYVLDHSPGFRIDHTLTMSFNPALAHYAPAQTEQFYKTLIERASAAPGVKSAALASFSPMSVDIQPFQVTPEGYRFPPGKESDSILSNVVDPHYFETFGVALTRGRGFLESDQADSPKVAIVNEAFVQHYYSGANPIGKRFKRNDTWFEIVGVTATTKYLQIFEGPTDFLYLPLRQNPQSQLTLLAETTGDPAAMAGPLRNIVHSLDPNLPVFSVRTMSDLIEQRSITLMHVLDGVVGSVTLLGLVLALVGLYAVVAYQAARRTREIGIRMAVGAARRDVVKMILKQAVWMGVTGVAIGFLLSFGGGRALTAQGMPAFDPILFSLAPLALLLTTLLAAAIPAFRASRVDPMVALRQD